MREMIRNGPPDDAGTPRTMLGMALWWRLWATLFWGIAPLVAGAFALEYGRSPFGAVFVTWVLGWWLVPVALETSPKYEISINY